MKVMTMSDLIRRADAIEALVSHFVPQTYTGEQVEQARRLAEKIINALPSAEAEPSVSDVIKANVEEFCHNATTNKYAPQTDLISRELAMERIANDNVVGGMERINEYNNSTEFNEYLDGISDAITTIFCDVPSADITETETCQRCQEAIDKILNRQGERIKVLETSAEAVQGEWDCMIADGNDGSHWHEYECSNCGEVVLRPYNYCPNCGARMKGGDE